MDYVNNILQSVFSEQNFTHSKSSVEYTNTEELLGFIKLICLMNYFKASNPKQFETISGFANIFGGMFKVKDVVHMILDQSNTSNNREVEELEREYERIRSQKKSDQSLKLSSEIIQQSKEIDEWLNNFINRNQRK